ncbi:hypothetical protein MTR67_018873 [Solanum verrucosum]|uniref:Uncharacterized protein n=1 Tax=Solanum verrucosum TaxID=315347 RepID=A0AAF0QNE1_SOLVR|nr:hypothetical protein MTR67_018873 [Solanum verrucosum]
MSPFLFLLAMEGLNYMVRKANELGWIGEVFQIRHLRAILTIFEGISCLHVTWQKSCLFPVNQVNSIQGFADNLGSQVASLPTKYLGCPWAPRIKNWKYGVKSWREGKEVDKVEESISIPGRRFIAEKYGLRSNWITEEVNGTFGCSVWKTIRRMWFDFNAKVTFKVGNGLKTSFWNKIWLGDVKLRILFPNLYIISLEQNDTKGQIWSWDLMLRRALNDWEVGCFRLVSKHCHRARQPILGTA